MYQFFPQGWGFTREFEGKSLFECHFCGKRCTQKSNLDTHINSVHEKAKLHNCDICKKYFTSFKGLPYQYFLEFIFKLVTWDCVGPRSSWGCSWLLLTPGNLWEVEYSIGKKEDNINFWENFFSQIIFLQQGWCSSATALLVTKKCRVWWYTSPRLVR